LFIWRRGKEYLARPMRDAPLMRDDGVFDGDDERAGRRGHVVEQR
jgi:hypothetical protein